MLCAGVCEGVAVCVGVAGVVGVGVVGDTVLADPFCPWSPCDLVRH